MQEEFTTIIQGTLPSLKSAVADLRGKPFMLEHKDEAGRFLDARMTKNDKEMRVIIGIYDDTDAGRKVLSLIEEGMLPGFSIGYVLPKNTERSNDVDETKE